MRRHPGRWDVVDAMEGDLPYRKSHLRHEGLLVCRSLGARAAYRNFTLAARLRWPDEARGRRSLRPLREWEARRLVELGDRAARAADLVLVPNRDEEQLLAARLGLGERIARLPFGLSEARMAAFGAGGEPPARRHAAQRLAFVGYWTTRKGSRDLPEILRRLRLARPGITLLLLGVGVPPERVLPDFVGQAGVEVVQRFDSEELPRLLATATVGVFPSYVEGFGFAVLEKLASGMPVIAYDAPGAREMLSDVSWPGLTPPGDLDAFVDAVLGVLDAPAKRYAQMSREAREVAMGFRWRAIARQTLTLYEQGLKALPRVADTPRRDARA
jgi:glycosyltransferase involved in cell wall biosynthesis